MRTITAIAALFIAAGTAYASDAVPVADADILTHGCAYCHGPSGISQSPIWPSLAGLDADYIGQQLDAFARGTAGARRSRHAPQMYAAAAGLSAAERQAVARYYAELPSPQWQGNENAAGASLYRDGTDTVPACAACHGGDAGGNAELGGPRLAGQSARYLAGQLRAYADGSRDDAGTGMRAAAAAMTDDEVRAVSAYLSQTP